MLIEPEHLDGIEPVLGGHPFRAGAHDIDLRRGMPCLQVVQHGFH